MERYDGPWTEAEAAHLCRRAAYGGTPEEHATLAEMGMQPAVSALVDYDPDDHSLDGRIQSLRDFDEYQRIKNPETDASLQGWWIYRMVHTPQPFQEQLTLFFHDHFVSEWSKVHDGVSDAVNDGNDGSLPEDQRCTSGTLAPDGGRRNRITARLLREQNELYRREGHGAFRDLLRAVTRNPAMLIYLDNQDNEKERPQENYARELMELFSMGIGNYSEDDVREVAKALTGETLKTTCALDYPYSYFFHPSKHSREPKTVFGTTFNHRGRGEDTEQVIELVLNRVSNSGISDAHSRLPAASLYMSWKFITWFVNEDIPISHPAVEELAEIFYTQTPNGFNYDVREALRVLLESKLFYDSEYRFSMYKHPVDYVVTALRSLGVEDPRYTTTVRSYLASMGMELFSPPSVNGWIHGRAWINSSSIINRFNYADRVSRRVILNRKKSQLVLDLNYASNENDHEGVIEFLRERLIQQPLTGEEMDVLLEFAQSVRGGREDFRRRVNGLAHVMMSMPKYQQK
ncbi:DUF1800 domain-containing protein [bacterium]|nr:DUF1800 domain-containing protein [bacterium]